MRKILLSAVLFGSVLSNIFAQPVVTPYEKDKLSSATYQECIDFYLALAKTSDMVKIMEYGETDFGKPLHLVVVSKDRIFDPEDARKKGKVVVLVNNGIHPGEPDGIDASMLLVKDLVTEKVKNPATGMPLKNLLDNVVFIVIPVYNIGGASNRNNFSRVNQIGPKEYGFRGNAQNRDLNRDFIKCDTKNAEAFIEIFQDWSPELFVDTHTTDGADYQYKMTYIATHHNKLEAPLDYYMKYELIPFLEDDMKQKNFPVCPYVTTFKTTPDSGIVGFFDTPRYSTGYTALFNTIGFVSESHMLKTHQERVEATYEFLVSLIKIANRDYKKIRKNKEKADENSAIRSKFALTWQLDSARYTRYMFSGYETVYRPSKVTGFNRLIYDRSRPFTKEINFYDEFKAVVVVNKPAAYIVPKGWWRVAELLENSGVETDTLAKDQVIEVESYYIDKFDTRTPPFEGHYLHSNTQVRKVVQSRKFFEGDYVVYTDQPCNHFIIQVLEPQSPDSYFNWNFFDAVLQQKEYYDSYLFEDIADSLLDSRIGLRTSFENKKENDEKFRNDPKAQLDYIYENTIREPEFMRYPAARLVRNQKIEVK